MSSAYLACTTRRLSLSVGVSSSLSAVHSTGSSRHRLTCWTRASRSLAAATASPTSAGTAGGPPTPASQRVADQWVRHEQVLDDGRRHVLPAGGDDDFLLAVHYRQE